MTRRSSTATRRARRRTITAVAAVVAAVLALAACSQGGTDESGAADGGGTGVVSDVPVEGQAREEGADAAGGGSVAPGAVSAVPPSEDRAVIATVDLVVEVDDVDAAAGDAEAVAIRYGGYVQSESTGSGGVPLPVEPQPWGEPEMTDSAPFVSQGQAVLVLRVPAERVDDAVDALEGLGETVSRSRSTQDVTEQVVDVESRIESQQASIDRLQRLLADATDIADVLAIETELTSRLAELESLQARQQQLADLTTLATVTVTFAPPQTVVEQGTGFVAGLEAGWRAFVRAAELGMTALGALLPFAVFAGVLLVPLVTWLVLRQRRRARRAVPAPGTPVAAAEQRLPSAEG
jgi:hypothetical protein